MMTSGLPLPKKLLFGKKDFNNINAFITVSICTSLVITNPIDHAPATECVQKLKTHILCSSIFEKESTKISSDDCCIYNKIFVIRKASFYKHFRQTSVHMANVSLIFTISRMLFFACIGFQ